MKHNIFILMMFFLLSCADSQFNNIEISDSDELEEIVVSPKDIYISQDDYSNMIFIQWAYPDRSQISFFLYRGESENGPFDLIQKEIYNRMNYCDYVTNSHDHSPVIPGKKYYYKLKAFSYKYGFSDFSRESDYYNTGTWGRALSVLDDISAYEDNNSKETATEIIVDANAAQHHAIYPVGDIDWLKVELTDNNLYKLNIISTNNTKVDIKSLNFGLFREDNFLSLEETGESLDISKLFEATYTGYYYLKIFEDTKIGEYKVSFESIDLNNYINLSRVSTDKCDYVALIWSKYDFPASYTVFRSESETGPFNKINIVEQEDRLSEVSETSQSYAYDKSASIDTDYYYYIVSKSQDDLTADSNILQGKRPTVFPDSYEDDNSPLNATSLSISSELSFSIYPQSDVDWVKFSGVKDRSYSIKTSKDSNNPGTISIELALYDSSNNILAYTERSASNVSTSILNWICPDDGSYFIRSTGGNNTGFYNIILVEN